MATHFILRHFDENSTMLGSRLPACAGSCMLRSNRAIQFCASATRAFVMHDHAESMHKSGDEANSAEGMRQSHKR